MPTFAYIGCRTTRQRAARGQGIEVYLMAAPGEGWRPVQSVDGLENPSYLIVEPCRGVLYAVHGDGSEVSAFRIQPASGRLALMGRQSSGGRNPVHLCMTKDADHLVVANYATGTVAALPVDDDGALAAPGSVLALPGQPGPHRTEQHGSHPHQVLRLPGANRFVFPDKGADRVWMADFDSATGCWQQQTPWHAAAREGAGPRHAVLHPDGWALYVANELDSTLTTYAFTSEQRFSSLHVISLLPESFTGNSRAAGIALEPRSMTLYISNRGHESVTCIALDRDTGLPASRHWISAGGETPRFITLDASARQLIVANETSDTIQAFSLHDADGKWQLPGLPTTAARTGSPTCVAFYQTDNRSNSQ
ncbi:lactonase family protein [Cupriavidus basilensis]|uniref:lactonase family protein n=1 Tax=Cupriavidus basilensis TaxID=68895 RepID=UPI00157A5081|nr:lactonase family protein [Cupriavidus basilensis]